MGIKGRTFGRPGAILAILGVLLLLVAAPVQAALPTPTVHGMFPSPRTNSAGPNTFCATHPALCTPYNADYGYFGHDEPSLLFYSTTPGSGNSSQYTLTLPAEPPTPPNQTGTGGIYNFQLHVAFWFGMVLCDSQSDPNYTSTCVPDTDANIFDNPDPTAPDFIGHHPGTAYLEMQFYPPGGPSWAIGGTSCDATKWCAALNIDSLPDQPSTESRNNQDCLNRATQEPVNFAFLTLNGIPQGPPSPLAQTQATLTPNPATDLFMSAGDTIKVDIHDTSAGLATIVTDQTTGQTGSMVASAANGFAQVNFQPNALSCSQTPYNFHPMYASSTIHTRATWTAHSYNVAFADETGHFEYCNAIDANGNCITPGVSDPGGTDSDDTRCFDQDTGAPTVTVIGCFATEADFDGVPYGLNWPGTSNDPNLDAQIHAQPIQFSSAAFNNGTGLQDYSQVAFETDLPPIEGSVNPPCDTSTGQNCTNPTGSKLRFSGGSQGDEERSWPTIRA